MGQILCAFYRNDESTLTGMLSRIERTGLIDRRRVERDGHLVRVRLGRSLEADVIQVAKEVNKAFLAGLGKTEVARA